jgi:uncharacterized membrane protein YphA (DoxX/SURF4 family)
MTAKIPPSVGLAARVLVGAVLVYAGATKAAGPAEEFAIVVGSYDLLPRDMVLTAATFLPWVEMLIGWSLILGFKLRATAAAAGALFAAFLCGLISVQAKGIQLPNCGCFGDAVHFTPIQALLFDTCLAVGCWLAWRSAPAPLSLDSWAEGGYTGPTNVQR